MKGDAKLAFIFIALLLIIAAVPILLSPSLTGFGYFSLEPETHQQTTASRVQSLITGYIVKAIPTRGQAMILVVMGVLLAVLGYIAHRLKRPDPSEQVELEAETEESLEEPPPIETEPRIKLDLQQVKTGAYDDALEKIQKELDRL